MLYSGEYQAINPQTGRFNEYGGSDPWNEFSRHYWRRSKWKRAKQSKMKNIRREDKHLMKNLGM